MLTVLQASTDASRSKFFEGHSKASSDTLHDSRFMLQVSLDARRLPVC